jgi:hypothetical protein
VKDKVHVTNRSNNFNLDDFIIIGDQQDKFLSVSAANEPEWVQIVPADIDGSSGTAGQILALDGSKVPEWQDSGLPAYRSHTFVFNYSEITGQGKPTLVSRGLYYGFSLPIYASDNEELFACACMDGDWDGTTDPQIFVGGWLPSANDTKKFNLQVSVEAVDFENNAVVPVTTNDYPVETTTGTWDAYTSFKASVTLDASAIGLVAGYPLAIRIRRLAASGDEIAGEVVVEGAALYYLADKHGVAP